MLDIKGFVAQCSIKVIDANKKFYALNTNGWKTSSILSALQTERTELNDTVKFEIEAATYQNDYFYATDKDGVLWKFNEEQTDIVKLGDLRANIANERKLEKSDIKIIDITVNAFDKKMYVIASIDMNGADLHVFYEVNTETGDVTFKMIDENHILYRVGSFAFVSETDVVVYDLYNQTINRVNLEKKEIRQLSWAQNTVDSGENTGMFYSRELNTLFYACTGFSTNKVSIFSINPDNGDAKNIGSAGYDSDLQALIIKE